MREKSVSLCERHCQQVSTMHGGVSSGTITQRNKANLSPSGSYSSLLNSPGVFLFFVPKKVCLRFGFWHPGLVRRKNPSPPEPPLRVGGLLSSVSQRSSLITRRFYASGYPGWLPRR
jgi:hypothetical protein